MFVNVHMEAEVIARCLPKSFWFFFFLRSLPELEAPQYDQVGQWLTPGVLEFLLPSIGIVKA